MAYSFQTGGYAFAPVLAKVDEQSLAGLKPISFSGGGQSPVQFRPTAGINVPSSRPELIGQGIASGLGSIAQGIQAAFKSKQDKEETLRKEGREERLLSEKYDREEKMRENRVQDEAALARFKASLPKQYQPDGSIAPNYDSEGEAGDYGTSAMSSAPVPTAYPKAERYDRDFSPIKGGSFESINLPEEDTTGDVFRLDNGSSPLSSITAPVDQSAAPSPRGEEALRALSSIDWSKVKGGLVASTEAFPEPVEMPAQAPDWLRKPKAVTAPLSTLGGFSDQALENTDKALADIQLAYAEQPAVAPKATSGLPKAAFKSYAEAQRYIDSQADNPNWYAESAPKPDKFGNFIIPWKQQIPTAKSKTQKTGEDVIKPEESFKQEKALRDEFDNQSKNFKVMQNAWNNLKGKLENPTGASDMSLIFAYMKLLDPTSTIREGEYATASNVGTIPQTVFGKYNKAVKGNGFLDPEVRDSFINEAKKMYQSTLKDHKQSISEYQRIAKNNNLNPENVIINLVTKDEADQAKEEMEALRQELSAVAVQDRATYPNFNSKKERYKALKKAQDQNKSLEQPNTQTPSTPQTPNATNQGIFSNYFKAPPIF
jgi:hypothetical protein